MKIKCSECGKKIRMYKRFRKIQGKDMHENCYESLGGYDFYNKLMKLKTGSDKPAFPPPTYMLE